MFVLVLLQSLGGSDEVQTSVSRDLCRLKPLLHRHLAMFDPRLVLFLCLIAASHVASERRPLRAALNQLLDSFLDVVAPVSAALGDSPCRRQGELYQSSVRRGQAWALRMLDAGAKLPSGLLLHNVVQFGDFEACLDVRHEDLEVGVVEGQHCQVSFGPINGFSTLSVLDKGFAGAFNMSYLEHFDATIERGEFLSALRMIGGSWAVCVPAACSAAQLQLHLRSALTEPLLRVDEFACTSRADAEPVWDWHVAFSVLLLSVLSVLLAIGTTYDLLTGDVTGPPRIGHPLLAFSIFNNTRLLLSNNTPTTGDARKKGGAGDGDALESIHGVRCLAVLAIILAHYFVAKVTTPLANISYFMNMARSRAWMVATNGTLHVDTFLVMSGILLSYGFIHQRERRVEFSWRRFFINRYVRIAPAHVASVLMTVAAMPFTQMMINAPPVKANIAPVMATCFNRRWLSLIYVSNYVDSELYCQSVAWYLNIEIQLLLLSPLVLVPLWRQPRLGLALIALLSLASIASVFSIAYQHRLHVISPATEKLPSANMELVYFMTHTRCVPWLIGLAVGSLLSLRVAVSRRQAALGWCTCFALGYYAMFHAVESFQPNFVRDRLQSAIFFALMRPAWALAAAWLIFACETGAGGHLHAFLAWRGWQLPSRLSYGVFLTHLSLLAGVAAISVTSNHMTNLKASIEYLGVVVLSLFCAAVLHVAVEMPCGILYHSHLNNASVARQQIKKQS